MLMLAQPAGAVTGQVERTPQLWLDPAVAELRYALGSSTMIQIGALAITVAAAVAVTLSCHWPARHHPAGGRPDPAEGC